MACLTGQGDCEVGASGRLGESRSPEHGLVPCASSSLETYLKNMQEGHTDPTAVFPFRWDPATVNLKYRSRFQPLNR